MTRTPRTAERRLSTRTLLTLAAIGVVAGVVTIPTAALAQFVWAVVPPVYGLLVAPYILSGVIAQAIVPRGGSALIAGAIAGMVAMPFTGGAGPLAVFLFVAVLQELPYLLTRWRRWDAAPAYAGAAAVAIGYAAFWWFTLDAESFPPLLRAATIAVLVTTVLAATALGRAVASGVRRAGVGRDR